MIPPAPDSSFLFFSYVLLISNTCCFISRNPKHSHLGISLFTSNLSPNLWLLMINSVVIVHLTVGVFTVELFCVSEKYQGWVESQQYDICSSTCFHSLSPTVFITGCLSSSVRKSLRTTLIGAGSRLVLHSHFSGYVGERSLLSNGTVI